MKHLDFLLLRMVRPVVALVLLLVVSACGGEKPEVLLASGREYLAKNEPKAAIIQLKNALQQDVTLAEARYLLGIALVRTGDNPGGEAEFRKALSYKYPEEQVLPAIADAMFAQGQYRKLADEFSKEKLKDPVAQSRLQTTLAAAYAALGKGELSRDAVQAALEAVPSYAPALLVRARDKAAQGDFGATMADVDAILAVAPDTHEAWKLKGDVLWFSKRQADEAMAAYRRAIGLRPNFVEAHLSLLDAMFAQGKFEDAASQLEQLKKVAAGSFATRYYETLLAYRKNDLKTAMGLSQQLLQLGPDNVRGLQLVGEVAIANNAFVQAQSHLSEVLRLAPQSARARRLLVETYLRTNQPAKALAVLQPLLRAEKSEAVTQTLAGMVFLQNGDIKKAQEYFAYAASQDPKNVRARTSLALTQLAGGSDDAALGQLREISAFDGGTAADLALISALLHRREYDKALVAIGTLEKKQPERPQAANLRGYTFLAKKDLVSARKSFERAVALDPGFFPPVASLALMDVEAKRPEEARKRFEALLVKEPNSPVVLMALAELRARSGGPKAEVVETMNRAITANPGEKLPRLLLVEYYLRNQDFKPALSSAQNAVTALPDSPELLDVLGRVQQASGDVNQALATFGKLASMQPESPLPPMRLANAYMTTNNRDAAAIQLRKALALKPDLLDAQRGLVMLAVSAGNYAEALSLAKSVQKQRPKEIAGYLFEGDLAAVQKKWEMAADAYRAGVKQVASPVLASKIHSAMVHGDKPAEAASFANGWLRDNPRDVDFRLYLGNDLSARRDYAAAEKIFASVLQIQPDNASAFNNLALVGGAMGKVGALALAEKAVALDPGQAAYMDTLAMLLSDKDEYTKALEWQTRALALQPNDGQLKLNLAKIHIKGGKKELARQELDALARMGAKFGGQEEVTALLKNL